MNGKPKVIKDFERLEDAILSKIKASYPYGFSDSLINYVDKDGKNRSALPFETEDKIYLIRMTEEEAIQYLEDDDFSEEGTLADEIDQKIEEELNSTENDMESDIEEVNDMEKESV